MLKSSQIMRKVISLLYFFTLPIYALTTDRNQLVELLADSVEINATTKTGRYQGHVRFSQGSSHLEADAANTHTDKDNQLTYASAHALKKHVAHFWTKINETDPTFHAYAELIEYFPNKHLIILKGQARVIQGNNQISAPVIRFDTLTRHLITENNQTSRTKIVFYTDKKDAKTFGNSLN